MPAPSRTLVLPPPFRLLALREAGDAFGDARAHADRLGAGTLVFVGRFDIAEFAVVLEPEESLRQARRSFYAGMTALADVLAALAPPETPIAIDWPDAIEIDGGLVGGGRLAWPAGAAERDIPDWLVFGAFVRLVRMRQSAGVHRDATALTEEGFGLIGAEQIAEAFARHLMRALDYWQNEEARLVEDSYVARLRLARGARAMIDDAGDLIVERPDVPAERRDLRGALAAPSWLDPRTGEPRL